MNIESAIITISRIYGIILILLVIFSFIISIILIGRSRSKLSKFASLGFGLLLINFMYLLIRHYFILDLIKIKNYLLFSSIIDLICGIILLIAILFLALSQGNILKKEN
jgi:hypothetical protein